VQTENIAEVVIRL